MKKIAISLLSLTVGLLSFAQDDDNMVENGSFEQIEGKIKREGAITAAVGWMSPTKAAADLFSAKVKDGLGTPENFVGYEEPKEGKNYAGIRIFSYNDKEPRQYLSTKLKLPLRKDAKYCIKFYVNLAEGSKYAANNVGISFSKKQYNIDENKTIQVPTDMMHRDNPVINAFFGWEEVCGIYTAKGGEKFLTLGNFTSNGETENQRLKKAKDFTGMSVMSAYYYIDDISVKMIDDESECDCKIDESTAQTEYVYEEAAVNPEGMSDDLIVQYTKLYFGYGKSNFTTSDFDHLTNIENVMKANDKYKLTIVAHTDAKESTDDKLEGLDTKRAQAVKKYLMDKGILADRIAIKPMGANEPQESGTDEISMAKNRRVTFILNQ
ncbi:OmpA family protein [Paracrocinitomix mangrovi]|uniref:OmpA family protein n=1 Tax=Paracrocinitomix mangrovi TaxID=2862509 RepID=UPI001C8D0D1D|nr:OmpA family protein [Paracrocinitomix mangrovi]UKN02847.1 OmpA family protein [Paracrocinitomix mangrovi]